MSSSHRACYSCLVDSIAGAVRELRGGPCSPPGVCLAVSGPAGVECVVEGTAQCFDDTGTLADPPPMTIDTRTDAGSLTKVVATTAALATLADAGEVTFNARIDTLLPWMRARPAGMATLEELLRHRAGLWEWWPLYVAGVDHDAALEAASELPLRYAPGTGRHYSDLGFLLLGAVVEHLAGCELPTAFEQLVGLPFGLQTTSYARPTPGAPTAASSRGDAIEEQMVRTGRPYPVTADADAFDRWRTQVLVGEINDGNAFHAFGGVAGHAGLFTTASDLLRFGDGLLASLDGSGPLSSAMVRALLAPGPDPGQAVGLRSWGTEVAGCRQVAYGHTGFPGVGFAFLPGHGATLALVTNRLHVSGEPASTEAMAEIALDATHHHLHARESRP